MAKTPSSSVSESVTLRIPNELYAQIKTYAKSHTRGNRSQAILELLETGLFAVNTQSSPTVQDNQLQVQVSETRETVTALSEQVSQLSQLVQETVLQRLTVMETELGELSAARDEVGSLPQPIEELSALRERILSGLKLGKQAPTYKAAQKALDQFITGISGYH